MKTIFENVIKKGGYDLSDIVKKINESYIVGKITEEESVELVLLARENAKAKDGVDVFAKLVELEERIRALEDAPADTDEYPEYIVGKWYYNGDKVTFEGEAYLCIAPVGAVCTWSPTEYPAYWEKA